MANTALCIASYADALSRSITLAMMDPNRGSNSSRVLGKCLIENEFQKYGLFRLIVVVIFVISLDHNVSKDVTHLYVSASGLLLSTKGQFIRHIKTRSCY